MKILIIEDEYSLADAIRESLEKEYLQATIVANGEVGEDEAITLYSLLYKVLNNVEGDLNNEK